MLKNCPHCNGKLRIIKKKKMFDSDNSEKVSINCKLCVCENCGEEFFDEKQSLDFAGKIKKSSGNDEIVG